MKELIALAIVLFPIWCFCSKPRGSRVSGRRFRSGLRSARAACGHAVRGTGLLGRVTEADLWRHENGHARLMRRYGVGVGKQRVWTNSDGSVEGFTEFGSPSRFQKLPTEKQIAIYAAGGEAMGSRSHNGSDDPAIKDLAGGDGSLERRGRKLARRDL